MMYPEGKIIAYGELKGIAARENGEELVDVRTYDPDILAEYEKPDMIPFIGQRILVRKTVAQKLADANLALQESSTFRLRVVYGYRLPRLQEEYFRKRWAELKTANPLLSDENLDTLTHNFVAVPSVAGHPTGGAIDVTLIDQMGTPLDMGTRIADWSDAEKIKTFAAGLSDTQKKNRRVLHNTLVQQGFAPFYGEWWHFSYGDREWACFYGKPEALYSAIEFKG